MIPICKTELRVVNICVWSQYGVIPHMLGGQTGQKLCFGRADDDGLRFLVDGIKHMFPC